MDENLINQTEEENKIEDVEVTEMDIPAEDITDDVSIEETVYEVVVEPEDEVVIDISESMGWVSGDDRYHNSLLGIDFPNQHPITAITGLRDELDEIEKLQTVYSNKRGNADYYEWTDGHAIEDAGYFVTLNEDDQISICSGDNIFGVVVDDAAFVGGQDDIARDKHYGLVATSGAVIVQCELDVAEGDYVVSNANGKAAKASSNRGYKVVALHDINGVPHATIILNITADQVDLMGAELQELDSRMDAAESNIVSAINVANQAYQKATEVNASNQAMSDKVDDALGKVDNMATDVENMGAQISNFVLISAQAKAIAESAATSAESMRNEAVEKANEALADTSKLREHFDDVATTMSSEIDGIKTELSGLEGGINDYKEEAKDTYVSRTDFTAFQDENTQAIAAVKKEASDTYATITSVAELNTSTSQAIADLRTEAEKTYATQTALAQLKTDTTDAISASENKATETYASKNDFTGFQSKTNIAMARIEQKADANGAYIQSTVSNMDKYSVGPYSQAYGFTLEQATSVLEEGMIYVPTISHEEKYNYTDENEVIQTYSRSFTPQYLYKWGKVNEQYRWITVDKNYTETSETNTSSKAVYFTTIEPAVTGNFGYWYTNGEAITGTTGTYEPYTLYKWESYEYKDGDNDEDVQTGYHWVAVATLAGNSNNRAVSQIRQDANSIELRVTNTEGDYAGIKADLSETQSTVQQLSKYANNGATIKTEANEAGSAVTIQSYTEANDGTITEQASLVLNVVKDADGNPTSALSIDADHINFEGFTTFVRPEDLSGTNTTTIDGSNITTGKIDASRINVSGDLSAFGATIGGWNITHDALYKNINGISSGMCSTTTQISESEGLSYRLSPDESCYFVDGIGTCTDTDVVIPAMYESKPVSEIYQSAFYYCTSLTSVVIPDSVTFIGDGAFYDCHSLTSVTIGNGVTTIGSKAFVQCDNLKIVTLGNSVTTIEDFAFARCLSLKGITIPSSVTSIGYSAFSECESLITITIPNSVTTIKSDVFEECHELTIYCEASSKPDGWDDEWNPYGCYVRWGNKAFGQTEDGLLWKQDENNFIAIIGCTDINPVLEIPSTINNYPVVSIEEFSFQNCTSLRSVEIPDSVTTIGYWAFANCTSLTSVIIPNSVTYIDDSAFGDCVNLTIYCEATSQPDGWFEDWNYSDCPVVWGHVISKNCNSLVVDGTSSYPRFFAGSNFCIPQSEDDANFLVLEDGSLYASAAQIKGEITAKTGFIGGWNITETGIEKDTVKLLSDDSVIDNSLVNQDATSPVRFMAQSIQKNKISLTASSENGSFTYTYMIEEENIELLDAQVVDLSAEDGYAVYEIEDYDLNVHREGNTVKIEGYNIHGPFEGDVYITLQYTYADPTLKILEDGSFYANAANITGTINANNGEIGGWSLRSPTTNDNVKMLVSKAQSSDGVSYSTGMASCIYKTDPVFWAGYTPTGDWDNPWERGNDESTGAKENYSDKTAFYVGLNGYMKASNANITGTITATGGEIGGWNIVDNTLTRTQTGNDIGFPTWTLGENIKFTHNGKTSAGAKYDTYLDFGWTYGSQTGEEDSEGYIKIYPYYGFVTNSNLAFKVGTGREGLLKGTWTSDNDLSDMRIKNSISDYTQEYEIFFDNIKPKRYKYNNGTSDRYHTGFIAQEVVEAIENSGLTTQDFAGVMLSSPNTEDERWYLRRDEFVSLNTWQIQKLKARVAELEDKNEKLEERLTQIEALLEKLTTQND